MTTAPAIIPLSAPPPVWTVEGTPPRDAIAQLAALCLDLARRRLAARAAAAGDQDQAERGQDQTEGASKTD